MSTPFPPLLSFLQDDTSQGKTRYKGAFTLVIETPRYSIQQTQILAITHTLQNILQTINILSDSQYSVHVTIHIETTTIKDTIPSILYTLFTNLQEAIRH